MGKSGPAWALLALLGATPAAAQVDFSGGFGTTTGLQNNGSSVFAGGRIQLTQAVGNQAGSCYFTTQQNVATFTSSSEFEFSNGTGNQADGMCFVIQRAGAGALGATGGGLGYSGIATSVAVKFDNYPSPNSYTGIYQNGAGPATPETQLNPGLDFHTTNIFRADLDYDGTTLDVTITDTVTNATASQTYTIDIPTVIGGGTAFVGFTAGTGGQNAIHEIVRWTFFNPPAAPATLTATTDQLGSITLTWAAVANAVSYNILRSDTPAGTPVQIANVLAPTTTYTDTVNLTPFTNYYYVVQAVGVAGTSANSPQATGYSISGPRYNDHDEGGRDGNCTCGSSGLQAPWPAFLAGLAALLAFKRRR